MNPRTKAKKEKQHASNILFLQKVITQGGPIGVTEGHRFNFLLRPYHNEIWLLATTLNPAFYDRVLEPYIAHPKRIPKWIRRTNLLIKCRLSESEKELIASNTRFDAVFFEQFMTQGCSYKQALAELNTWTAWL